jgi:D-galactarolactone isomerase
MTTPKLKAPPGTCDTHMHIYEPGYKVRPEVAKPPVAPVSEYKKLCQRLGITRTIFVQPNAYGADNACLLAAMKEYGPDARGVAVVTPDVSDAELERLTKAGIRAVRFMLLPGGFLSNDVFDTLAARVHEFGWHVNLQVDGRTFPEREAQLRRVKGNLVIDHVGKFLEPVPADHPSFRAMLRLLDSGRTWVKLSAPYEVSKVGRPLYGDVGTLACAGGCLPSRGRETRRHLAAPLQARGVETPRTARRRRAGACRRGEHVDPAVAAAELLRSARPRREDARRRRRAADARHPHARPDAEPGRAR